MLPFYSSVLTPKEQAEIEEIYREELTEELSKVKFLGPQRPSPKVGDDGPLGLHLLMGPTTYLVPLTQLPGDRELYRDGEFLEKVQQSETGTTEPPAETRPVVRNQR